MSSGTEEDVANRAKRQRASLVSLSANVCITVLKVVAALLTGSISLISESIHSSADVLVSLFTYFSIRAAAVPPDKDHPYGHGKIESLAGFGESLVLMLTVGYIFDKAILRLLHGASVRRLDIGIGILAFSAVTSFVVGTYVRRTAERTESIALKSNSRHQMADCVTSMGVLVALAVSRFTGWEKADAFFAMVLAVWIAYSATLMAREAVEQLIDRRVSDDDIETIHNILRAEVGLISYHRLRTRHSGNVHYIDVHVVVPNQWSVVQAHAVADRIEKTIAEALRPAEAVVHIDPYDPGKDRAKFDIQVR